MNPVQLYVQKDGEFKPIEGWGCGNCRRIILPLVTNNTYIATELGTKAAAEECCAPNNCECGKVVEDKYYIKCRDCRNRESNEKEVEKERARFERAKKVTETEYFADKEMPSFVFDPTRTYGDAGDRGWNVDLGELYQEYEDAVYDWETGDKVDEDDRPIEKPKLPVYVWASKPLKLSYDVSYIIEHISQDAYEGYEDSLTGVEELQKYIDDWCAQQPVSYEIDYSTAIVLNQPNETNSN